MDFNRILGKVRFLKNVLDKINSSKNLQKLPSRTAVNWWGSFCKFLYELILSSTFFKKRTLLMACLFRCALVLLNLILLFVIATLPTRRRKIKDLKTTEDPNNNENNEVVKKVWKYSRLNLYIPKSCCQINVYWDV